MKACALCKEKFYRGTNISFFRFPPKEEVKLEWCSRTGLYRHHINTYSVLCSKHFFHTDIIFQPSGVKGLKNGAMPLITHKYRQFLQNNTATFNQIEAMNNKTKQNYNPSNKPPTNIKNNQLDANRKVNIIQSRSVMETSKYTVKGELFDEEQIIIEITSDPEEDENEKEDESDKREGTSEEYENNSEEEFELGGENEIETEMEIIKKLVTEKKGQVQASSVSKEKNQSVRRNSPAPVSTPNTSNNQSTSAPKLVRIRTVNGTKSTPFRPILPKPIVSKEKIAPNSSPLIREIIYVSGTQKPSTSGQSKTKNNSSENIAKPPATKDDSPKTKRRPMSPVCLGDFEEEDLNCPIKRHKYWVMSQSIIEKCRKSNRNLKKQNKHYKKVNVYLNKLLTMNELQKNFGV